MTALSITEANHRGISRLVSSAEGGERVQVARHGRVVAEVVSAQTLARLRESEDALRELALITTRLATDSGVRTSLDQAMEHIGIDRDDLQAEIDAGLHDL